MTHEKDKRSSKIFGTRLSSIFGDTEKSSRSILGSSSNLPKNNLLKQSILTKSNNNLRSSSTSSSSPSSSQAQSNTHSKALSNPPQVSKYDPGSRPSSDPTRNVIEPTTPKTNPVWSSYSGNVSRRVDYNTNNTSPLASSGVDSHNMTTASPLGSSVFGSPQSTHLNKVRRKPPPDLLDIDLQNNLNSSFSNYNSNQHQHDYSNQKSESPQSDDFQFNTSQIHEASSLDDESNYFYTENHENNPNTEKSRPNIQHQDLYNQQHVQDLHNQHQIPVLTYHTEKSHQTNQESLHLSDEYLSYSRNEDSALEISTTKNERPRFEKSKLYELRDQILNNKNGKSEKISSNTMDHNNNNTNKINSNLDDLIDTIDGQINYFNIDSDLNDYNSSDTSSSKQHNRLPRSPKLTQLSSFNDGSFEMPLSQFSSNSRQNSPRVEKDLFLKPLDDSAISLPSESSRDHTDWSENSNSSPLKSKNLQANYSYTDPLIDSNLNKTSPKKDSFLNFSNVQNVSGDEIYTDSVENIESYPSGQMDQLNFMGSPYSNTEGLSTIASDGESNEISRTFSKMSELAYGDFTIPKEHKFSTEVNLENPIIENKAMISPDLNLLLEDTGVPYPVTTSGSSPPLLPADVNQDLIFQEVSLESTNSSFDKINESMLSRKSSETNQGFPRTSTNFSSPTNRTLSYGSKKNVLKPVLSSPLETSSSMQTYNSNHRRQSSSVSSIFSSHSNKPANLATIKKSLNLKPGEGERSNYVLTIRRSGGTAFNENGPGNWKLPIGIKPVDKASLASNANSRYKRMAGPFSQNRLKKSGVELKHGHLQPRLLAGEIDDKDTGIIRQKIGSIPELKPIVSESKSATISRGSSITNLARTTTIGSTNTMGDSQSIAGASSISSPGIAESIISTTSLDMAEGGIDTGYYQHPSYKYTTGGEGDDTEIENGSIENDGGYDDENRPKLVLVNPDISSDSD